MSTAVALQYRFFAARVVGARRIGASLIRVTLGGPELADFAGGGRDQSVSLFLPHPGQPAPVLPVEAGEDWFGAYRAMPADVRAVMRSYTIREQRPEACEVDIDFVSHGDTGPASRWARHALPGDQVVLLGPAVHDNRSVCFRPPAGTDSVLLVADETALPAAAGILAWLPADTPVRAWIEVPDAADIRELPTAARAEVRWVVRGGTAPGSTLLADAVRAARLPAGTPYAWVAGESSMVRAVRRHLVAERGLDRRHVTFAGYWRRGASEEDLRAEASAAAVA
ncbi:NADPH-dependent ferric siderophore reductase, contains FAD-binding and SIP domains [Micromonospora citrea]|uniref:NADPH-dependent ferric siderophore reductase, contains FAD-binding and SIP domains n=1 Tax=Micromonospora citrea TaxID=47855 RepID=A0A1C6TWR8_9ACTN|nr:siderophore-interacting protein [Micromonospora citrea]SCL46272.1 NADPH-dependent ferric siderophore reductase, contains FAD-binding and SIP domains [Micromonospora citrea]